MTDKDHVEKTQSESSPDDKRFRIIQFIVVPITVAVIGAIALVIAQLIEPPPPSTPLPEEATAVTSDSPTETVPPLSKTPPLINTPTPTNTQLPTDTPVPSPTTIPDALVLFEDDFENGAGNWTVASGLWELRSDEEGNHFYCVTTSGQWGHARAGDPLWTDYIVEFEFMLITSLKHYGGLLQFRYSHSPETAYEVEFEIDNADLSKQESPGTGFQWIANGPQTLVLGQWYIYRVEVNGENILISLGDEKVIEITDAGSVIRQGAIRLGAGPEREICYDNVRVYNLAD